MKEEIEKEVENTKRKQWCAHCQKEGNLYCCWNTTYCDEKCQKLNWAHHQSRCERNAKKKWPKCKEKYHFHTLRVSIKYIVQTLHLRNRVHLSQIHFKNLQNNRQCFLRCYILNLLQCVLSSIVCMGPIRGHDEVKWSCNSSVVLEVQCTGNTVL